MAKADPLEADSSPLRQLLLLPLLAGVHGVGEAGYGVGDESTDAASATAAKLWKQDSIFDLMDAGFLELWSS